jgi:hypothetical protein
MSLPAGRPRMLRIMIGIDLRYSEPRSAHECLGGVKLLARLVDKGWATIMGTSGPYVFYDCQLDRVFFDALNVTGDDLIAVLHEAFRSHHGGDAVALIDLRESLENEPEISDDTFLQHATASDLDNAAILWLHDRLAAPLSIIALINARVDELPAETFNDTSSVPGPVTLNLTVEARETMNAEHFRD